MVMALRKKVKKPKRDPFEPDPDNGSGTGGGPKGGFSVRNPKPAKRSGKR
jgi:hypothetical protein